MEPLISESQLIVGDSLLTRLEEKMPAVDWRGLDADLRQAYTRHVALLDDGLRQELGAGDLSESVAFYNAYYWILVFAKRYQARHRFDAGIEQETFKVLERAPVDVDWKVVERVNQTARRT